MPHLLLLPLESQSESKSGNGTLSDQIRQTEGFNKVMEMASVTTLRGSLQCVQEGGTVCMVGSVSGK